MSDATLPTVKWRDSVRFKLMLWSAVLVMVPTLLCAVWLNRMAATAMSQQHARTVGVTAQTLAASLAGKLAGGIDDSGRGLLASLRLDSRLAFVAVSDVHFDPLHQYTADADAWGQYKQWLARAGALGLAHSAPPIMLGRYGELVVHEAPIWNPPLDPRNPRQIQPEERKLEGFVLLALHEPQLITTLDRLWMAQATAAGVICLLAMPIAVWYSKRWTAPVRALLVATGRLALGLSPSMVKVKDKDELGVLAIAFNRSAQQLFAAQTQLRQANEDLEQKVTERTAELETANRRLESEIHDKNEFLRAVTHDLSAPLRNIGGMANMLILKHDDQLTDEAITKLKRITANVDVQAELIGDLMELSRIRSRPGKKECIDLQELLRKIGENLSYDLDRNRIMLHIDEGAPTIIAERNRIRQIFMNLLDNGIKYMGDSTERQITISFDQIDDELHFSVTDTGQGIDAKDLPHVFNVFRRGTYSGTHDVPGRGVGLASVKSIVECYGGRAWVESCRGVGSSFHFTLDAHQVAQVQATAS